MRASLVGLRRASMSVRTSMAAEMRAALESFVRAAARERPELLAPPELQSMQKVRAEAERKRSYAAVVHLKEKRLVQLAAPDRVVVALIGDGGIVNQRGDPASLADVGLVGPVAVVGELVVRQQLDRPAVGHDADPLGRDQAGVDDHPPCRLGEDAHERGLLAERLEGAVVPPDVLRAGRGAALEPDQLQLVRLGGQLGPRGRRGFDGSRNMEITQSSKPCVSPSRCSGRPPMPVQSVAQYIALWRSAIRATCARFRTTATRPPRQLTLRRGGPKA